MASAQSLFGSTNDLMLLFFLAAIPIAFYLGLKRKKRASAKKRRASDKPVHVSTPKEAMAGDIPIQREDPDLVERVAVSRYIAELMLADEWNEVGKEIAAWEAKLKSADGGARYHDVGADVALSGLQSLIDEVPFQTLDDLADAEIEVGYFVETHEANPDNHVLAALAARAHLAVGQACRADHWPDPMRHDAWRRMARHYLKAGEILNEYEPLAHMSPLLAEAHYLHALGSPGALQLQTDLFETWIELDPSNPAIYDRHADWLSDPEHITDDELLVEADKALARTESTLGTGGYALFFLPLLERRDGARELLDQELFATAMLDLASTDASQTEVNQAANALAAEMRFSEGDNTVLNDTLFVLISWHLEVIYPRVWSLAEDTIIALVHDATEAVPTDGFDAANETGSSIFRAA